jgi:hypothetical protein
MTLPNWSFSRHSASYGPCIVRQSVRNNEERWLAIGKSHDRIISSNYFGDFHTPKGIDQDHFSASSETE